MTSVSSSELLESGKAAMARKDYKEAHRLYIEASQLDTTNYVPSSNAAIASLTMKNYDDCLKEAAEAIKRDSAKAKPHMTRATALELLKRLDEAETEFQAAAAADPTNSAVALSNVDRLQKQRNQQTERARSAFTALRVTKAPPRAPASFLFTSSSSSPLISRVATPIITLGRLATLFLFIAYILPLGILSYQCYYALVAITGVCHILTLLEKHGIPTKIKAGTAWAQGVSLDASLPPIFLPVLFYTARPAAAGLLAFTMCDMYLAIEWIGQSLFPVFLPSTLAKSIASSAPSVYVAATVLQKRPEAVRVMRDEEFRAAIYEKCLAWEAYFEVCFAILCILELAFPQRNIILTFILWQSLQQRYLTSPYSQQAFSDLHKKITAVTQHRFCPGLIRIGYEKVTGLMYGQIRRTIEASMQQQGGGGGETGNRGNSNGGIAGGLSGMMSQCTVM